MYTNSTGNQLVLVIFVWKKRSPGIGSCSLSHVRKQNAGVSVHLQKPTGGLQRRVEKCVHLLTELNSSDVTPERHDWGTV
jgi:hypothetical protein